MSDPTESNLPPAGDPPSRPARKRTLSRKELARDARRHKLLLAPDDLAEERMWMQVAADTRPRTRSECADVPRPCPYASCRFHLALDVNPKTHSVTLRFPDKEIWEMEETCALDVADRGGETLEAVGLLLGQTRERVRQVEFRALAKVERAVMQGKRAEAFGTGVVDEDEDGEAP